MKSTNCFLNGTRFDHASGRDFLLPAVIFTQAGNSTEGYRNFVKISVSVSEVE